MVELINATAAAAVFSDLNKFTFNSVDYMVFVIMLGVSACIGVYFGFFAKSEDTTEEYLMGGKRMKTLPIAISLVASQLSAISIMTLPGEMFAFGINIIFNVVAMIIIIPILNYVVVPVFYNNNITNCYEYLEIRFNGHIRKIQTFGFVITLIFMLPVFIFVASLAFAQVTGFNVHIINTIVCAICVFYTMFGGIKAVVWTDVVQAGIMVASVVLVGVLGTQSVGGVGEVYRIAKAGGRLDVNFAFDATTRSTFWNIFISATVMWTSYVGFNQSCVQRIVSLPTLGHARRALVLFGGGFMLITFFNCFTGIVMYVRYHDCDPVLAGKVMKYDKLMPYFVQDVIGHLKGMPGVFISCVFSAALSTMSASLNALAGIVYFDYIKPHIRHTESRANFAMKAFVLLSGIYCVFGGIVVAEFASILQVVYSISGVTFGSVFGVFLLGMLVPRAHGRAALWGVVASMVCMSLIIAGAHNRMHYKPFPSSIEGCDAPNNSSTITTPTTLQTTLASTQVPTVAESFNILDLSYNWYTVLGALITWAVALPLCYILKPAPNSKFDPKLLSPIVQPFVDYQLTQADELPELYSKPKA